MGVPTSSRIRLISILVILVGGLIAVKLYLVQVVSGADLASRAEGQYVKQTNDTFDRGSIFFSGKDGGLISAATLKSGFTAYFNPKLIENADEVYQKISPIIEIDHDTFFTSAARKSDPYEEIAKKISQADVTKLEALGIPGLGFYKDKWRFYPGNSLAAQEIGFVAYQGDILAGRYGLERFYQDNLVRSPDSTFVNFFAELFSNLRDTFLHSKSLEGDIVTTIEPTVQATLERELTNIKTAWSSKEVGGIIINPKNGEIYALGISPTFDLNYFWAESDVNVFSNPLVENVYEMGSIMKPLTLAAGLDAGVITATTTYNDTGFLILNGRKIQNFDGKARGVVPMQEVLNQSLNIGATFVALKLGKQALPHYFESYGFDEETGIDLPNETGGLIGNLTAGEPQDISLATASFGQGIALTPIEIVRALSALGNGGVLVTPHLVRKINYKIGFDKTLTFDPPKQVLKRDTSETISRMLVQVFDKALGEGKYKMARYSIAAKTGTAQIANPNGGGYYEDKYLHSFFGYFPAFDPKFLVFLYQLEPQGVEYASQTLAAPFSKLAKFLISYYEIPPDR
ncbi:MAG: penicillin-binding protein 2 [Candidatus Paceibacterota bacterium]